MNEAASTDLEERRMFIDGGNDLPPLSVIEKSPGDESSQMGVEAEAKIVSVVAVPTAESPALAPCL
jgi:hypothetical protein